MFFGEENYEEDILNATKELDKIKEKGYFDSYNNVKIYYEKYKNRNAKKSIVILHGFCENIVKYTEVIYTFYKKGYSVYAIEHRGMARSTHLGKDISQVHLDKFAYYIYDIKKFVENYVKKDSPANELYLFAHSLGGLIGTRYVQIYPSDFKKVILSSPFFKAEINYPYWAIRLGTALCVLFRQDKRYIFIHHKYEKFPEFEMVHTTSKARYEFNKSFVDVNEEFQMKGGSYKWLLECSNQQKALVQKKNIDKLEAKILLLSCGKDRLVTLEKHEEFCELVDKCEIYRIPESKHESYFETDDIVEKFWNKIDEFLEE